MPFDAADFDGRGRPASDDHSRWEWLNNLLHRLALLLAWAALVGVLLLNVACVVVIATGNRPECVIIDPFRACRQDRRHVGSPLQPRLVAVGLMRLLHEMKSGGRARVGIL